ncbi:hypothetical protein P152DRAFT_479967 [Eremomyces bilateralis CBS 781.70]|uniref:DSC E3 ubiquitin ligase complex subunit A n=1 Tax=Eremomyces bilateralis CBS 781.70 TaxID=1392243 RepID=A0A6G1G9S7_9PEZI|nr:uncharacterized protein P152DRAFT_479967 [Eremomyces bilateralis CBS 781.70]KAF1814837.1 hypothetical protein P152DRAFT_479967 [Eremomyces bilateralis CBS 781.70]
MANPRATILTLLLLFLLLTPDTPPTSAGDRLAQSSFLATEHHALSLLANASFPAFDPPEGKWMNLTAFREGDGMRWDLWAGVRGQVRAQMVRALGERVGGLVGEGGEKRAEETAEGGQEREQETRAGDDMLAPMYRNVSGYIKGSWVRSRIAGPDKTDHPAVNLTQLVPERRYVGLYLRNVTGADGGVKIRLRESGPMEKGRFWMLPAGEAGEVKSITAEVEVSDEEGSGGRWQAKLHGVHFVKSGGMVFSTTSEKFPGIFALPYFTFSEPAFALSKTYLNRTLSETVEKQQNNHRGWMNPWSSTIDGASDGPFAAPHCEYLLYLQQHPLQPPSDHLSPSSQTPIDLLERELRFPTGYHGARATPMSMSMVLFSPDCGVVLESKGPPDFAPKEGRHLQGSKIEVILNATRRHALLYAAVIAGQVLLMVRQMKDASTPSTLSRVSFYTIAMMSLGDGFGFVVFVPVSMFVESAFLPLLTTGFMAFVAVTFFDLRFLMDIWTVQMQERQRQDRSANATVSTPPLTPTPTPSEQPQTPAQPPPSTNDTLPLPATTPRPISPSGTIPIILPPDQDLTQPDPPPTADPTAPRRELGSLYSRFYFLLIGLALLSLHASSWPRPLRSAYANLLAFTYLSFWTPQIARNVVRNARKALGWRFIVGQSVLRVVPVAYLWGYPGNLAFLDVDAGSLRTLMVLCGWVWVQVWVLGVQELFGPRVVVCGGRVGKWLPPVYDYHPVLREDEEGGNIPVGAGDGGGASRPPSPTGSNAAESKDRDRDADRRGQRVFDCAICMHNLAVMVVTKDASGSAKSAEAAASGPAGLLARRAYMVTPCRHIFHTECLEGWMKYRLQCPICRETLPPL